MLLALFIPPKYFSSRPPKWTPASPLSLSPLPPPLRLPSPAFIIPRASVYVARYAARHSRIENAGIKVCFIPAIYRARRL